MKAAWVLLAALSAAAGEYRAFWADAFHDGFKTPAQVDRMIDDVARAHGNAIFLQVRRRGDVYFLRSTEPPAEDATYQRGFDALEYSIEKAHARGIEVHAWFVVTPLWDNPARPPAAANHVFNTHGPTAEGRDMWMTLNAAGRASRSLDPGHPDAARHLVHVITEALRHYDVDGIHLDYIRYPEDDVYGWNPTAVERFNRIHARAGSPSNADTVWSEFRRRQVTDLVRQIYLRAAEIRPQAKVSAALITWGNGPSSDAEFRSKDAYSRVFQNWPAWLEEGILDIGMPMNYFEETRNGALLTNWLNYETQRQGRRFVVPGLGVYLNEIPNSLAQIERVRARAPAGVALYSYASTNTLVNNVPRVPNAEFYSAVATLFGGRADPPAMPWKERPATGHMLGSLTVDGGPPWLNDNVEVTIHSDTDPAFARRTATDGTGFFGAVDLPPDRYFVRLSRAGEQLFRTAPLALQPGKTVRFDVFLKEADFVSITPQVAGVPSAGAAPGEVITLRVAPLNVEAEVARSVPLPLSMAGVQVLVNGNPAAISAVWPGAVDVLMPWSAPAGPWTVQVRYAGLESAPVEIARAAANPVIVGARRTAWGYELYATGLGDVSPPPASGAGGVLNTVSGQIRATVDGRDATVLWAGLQPYQPYIYQVNIAWSEAGGVRVEVDGRTSALFPLPQP